MANSFIRNRLLRSINEMASLARFVKNTNFLYTNVNYVQSVRTGTSFKNHLKRKEYYDGDRLADGTTTQAALDSLASRGFCRPRKPYNPPEDIDQRLKTIFGSFLPESVKSNDWKSAKLDDSNKFELLTHCIREFSHDIPNTSLRELKTLGDVSDYFKSPVTGLNPYEVLVNNRDKLPDNLHVIPEGIRFNPFTDTMFKGISAYPGRSVKVTGLRSRRKYEGFDADSEWPYEITAQKV